MPEIQWTKHSEAKMRFHHLSKQRVRRVLNSSKRIESGIAPDTMAMMQVSGSNKHPYEIWVMFVNKQQSSGKLGSLAAKLGLPGRQAGKRQTITRIISAWRYPGRTKPGEPLPPEIMAEIRESL